MTKPDPWLAPALNVIRARRQDKGGSLSLWARPLPTLSSSSSACFHLWKQDPQLKSILGWLSGHSQPARHHAASINASHLWGLQHPRNGCCYIQSSSCR